MVKHVILWQLKDEIQGEEKEAVKAASFLLAILFFCGYNDHAKLCNARRERMPCLKKRRFYC